MIKVINPNSNMFQAVKQLCLIEYQMLTLISLINVESMLTNFEKFHPPQKEIPPSTFIEFITKVSNIIAEPNDDFSHSHFEL